MCSYNVFWARRLCINVLKAGPIPKHIGFIMDDQRRYSRKHSLTVYESNRLGVRVLQDFQQLFIDMGVPEVTIYVFSVHNKKRNLDDKFAVLSLIANICYIVILDDQNECFEMMNGIQIRLAGDISFLPECLQRKCAQAILKTQHNNKLILTMAMGYASRYEITNSVKCIVDGVEQQMITVEDINEQLFSDCLYTSGCSDVDVIVRSSGETRLSDFLTWQSCTASLEFISRLWPE